MKSSIQDQNNVNFWQRLKTYIVTAGTIGAFLQLNWALIWKILFASAVVSIHIWGDNNWYEQIVEAANKWITDVDVDISKEAAEHSYEPRDLKKYIPSER